MEISRLSVNEGASVYYSDEFRTHLEDHITYLKNSNEISILNIEPAMAYKYEGDLFGLLYHYNIVFEYHWIVMRVNNFTNPNQNKATLTSLYVPNRSIIERIKNVYMTKNRIVH